jgi:hypothetical protein
MGALMGKLSEHEDEWSRRATAAAIATARKVVLGDNGVINMNTPVGRLNDIEWGWIVSAAIFGWIAARAEQATSEGLDTELAIRMGMLDGQSAWDAGAVAAILPKLADTPGLDLSKSVADLPREDMVRFLLAAFDLIRTAMRARDLGGSTITRKPGADKLDDPVPSFQ